MESDNSQTLQAALGNDSTAAAAMWRAIADGQASASEILTWATHVAGRIKKEVLDVNFVKEGGHSSRRADAAHRAIGLYGKIDRDRQLRADIALFYKGESKLSRIEVAEVLQIIGSDLDGLTLKNAIKKIDRIRKKY
jgi:hypothetical protein